MQLFKELFQFCSAYLSTIQIMQMLWMLLQSDPYRPLNYSDQQMFLNLSFISFNNTHIHSIIWQIKNQNKSYKNPLNKLFL